MKKMRRCLLFCLLSLLFLGGCGDQKSQGENPIYLDLLGNCNFGSWASSEDGSLMLNGSKGWATLYMMSDEELDEWIQRNGLGDAETAAGLRENWATAMVAYAQCPDIMLKVLYDADDEGIAKFRAYVDDYLGDRLAAEKARVSPGDAPIYLDQNGNYDIGAWGDMGTLGLKLGIEDYGASDEEIRANNADFEIERHDGKRYTYTADCWRMLAAKEIISFAAMPDKTLQEMYGADAEAIEKFRAYYTEFFCQSTDIFEQIDPEHLEEEL